MYGQPDFAIVIDIKRGKMSNKTIGLIGMVLGGVIIVADVLVGLLGWPWLQNLVGFPSMGFGWKKITLLALGGLLFIVSVIIYSLAKRLEKVQK